MIHLSLLVHQLLLCQDGDLLEVLFKKILFQNNQKVSIKTIQLAPQFQMLQDLELHTEVIMHIRSLQTTLCTQKIKPPELQFLLNQDMVKHTMEEIEKMLNLKWQLNTEL